MDDVTYADFERLAKSHEELSAHVIALTAVVGGMATTSIIDYERLEECIHFAAMRLRPGRRPILLEKASLILSDFEVMPVTDAPQQRPQQARRRKRSTRPCKYQS